MKAFFSLIGWFIGMLVGFSLINVCPILGFVCIIGGIPLGRYVGQCIEESKEQKEKERLEAATERRLQEREYARKKELRNKAISLSVQYPEAFKEYFKIHWGIYKSSIQQRDITDDKVNLLLSHTEFEYQRLEEKLNPAYKDAIIREAFLKRQEEEIKRRANEAAMRRKEEEIRNLPNSLPACVANWQSHSNSSLKHKYFYKYYTYSIFKDCASISMWNTWHTVWNFKNDPSRGISHFDHESALNHVVEKVENAITSAFGTKTQYLTFVCLTASTQVKTEVRFKKFAEKICSDLKMNNAYSHIRVVEDGSAKHDGGTGYHLVWHDPSYFKGKYIILFDDVRTTGRSLDVERSKLEQLGSMVICAITIAQTVGYEQ